MADDLVPTAVVPLAPTSIDQPDPVYRWHWRKRLPDRYGQAFRVMVRGKRNACLIQFEDGTQVVTSRNALRRVASPGAQVDAARRSR